MPMRSKTIYDRIAQGLGLLILAGLAVALLLAAKEGLLPYQQDDDAFDTVFAYVEPEEEPAEHVSAPITE